MADEEKKEEELSLGQEVHDKELAEIIAEDNAEAAKANTGEVTPPQEEPKPQEEVIEEPKTPEPVVETPLAPVIDPEKLKQEISAEVAQKVVESLTGEDKKQGEEYPWEKEDRAPTVKEALAYVKEQAKAEIKAELEAEVNEEDARATEQEESTKKAQEETNRAWGTYWDNQLKDLEVAGELPPVKTPGDPNDLGVKARLALFNKMREVSLERRQNDKPVVSSLKEIYYENFKNKNVPVVTEQPAGADAPVFGASRSVGGNNDSDTFSAAAIHNADIGDILSGKV